MMFGAAALLIGIFLWNETRTPEPLLPLSLFRNQVIAVASIAGAISGAVMFGVTTFVPLFVQGVKGGTATDAGMVIAADQLTKAWIEEALALGSSVYVLPVFDLVHVRNTGAAFSFLANAPGWQTPFFVAVALVASAIVSWMLWRDPARRLLCTGLALILGGALGNLWDRLAYGHVVDFLDFHAMGWHWPAFNVADSGISVGAVILIAESFLHREAPRERGADRG